MDFAQQWIMAMSLSFFDQTVKHFLKKAIFFVFDFSFEQKLLFNIIFQIILSKTKPKTSLHFVTSAAEVTKCNEDKIAIR